MKLKVKDMDIATGGILVCIMNRHDAHRMDLHALDRILVRSGRRSTTAIVDIAESEKAVPRGKIGMFEEVLKKLGAKHNTIVDITFAQKPKSVSFIRRKLMNEELVRDELDTLVQDIVSDSLSESELTYFVAAAQTNGLSHEETVDLTQSIVRHGDRLRLKKKLIMDKHCTGGVPGNRTTMVLVPILVAAGLTVPKTSSRAITSPAGTADTMEVLAPVTLPINKMKSVVDRVGGCIVWGGAVSLASADDKLIKVRNTMGLDPEPLLLASILAKKAAVNATHVLIDIPFGPDNKVASRDEAARLEHAFITIGARLGMKIHVVMSEGTEPIGNGIGPALEARDVLWVLENNKKAPMDLRQKSLDMAGALLSIAGKKEGRKLAEKLLNSGKALEAMKKIIRAQGGNSFITGDKVKIGKCTTVITAHKNGYVVDMNMKVIARLCRIAGAPIDKGAGMLLHVHQGTQVNKGDPLFTLYAENSEKLKFAVDAYRQFDGFMIR